MDPSESANATIDAFKIFSEELTTKQDKYERITKISRDITIESKRLIFAILALPRSPDSDEAAVEKIRSRLKAVVDSHFKKIAFELENEDSYQFHRAYTFGVQEFIEAFTFFHYVTENTLVGWKGLTDASTFISASGDAEVEPRTVKLTIPLSDYILGVQDMTGEMMRLCVVSLGKGDVSTATNSCSFVKYIYAALHILPSCHNEFYRKLDVAGQSMRKMEYGCYLSKIQSLETKGRVVRLDFPSHSANG